MSFRISAYGPCYSQEYKGQIGKNGVASEITVEISDTDRVLFDQPIRLTVRRDMWGQIYFVNGTHGGWAGSNKSVEDRLLKYILHRQGEDLGTQFDNAPRVNSCTRSVSEMDRWLYEGVVLSLWDVDEGAHDIFSVATNVEFVKGENLPLRGDM